MIPRRIRNFLAVTAGTLAMVAGGTNAAEAGVLETAGPRVTPGVPGARCDTSQGAGELLLAAGTYANFTVPAGVTVKPRNCAVVRFTGQINVGDGSGVYAVIFQSPGSWSIRDSADNVKIQHSTFRGNPGIEHIRVEGSGWQISANRFEGNPTNHAIKVDGRNALTGEAVIADNLFTGAPGEDAIQYEGHEGTANQIVHNRFQGAGVEDHVDLKSGSDILVAWNQFAPTNQGECLLFQNGTGLSIAEHNVFEAGGCFLSFGANGQDVRGRAVANTFQAGSTLRLRESYNLLIAQNAMDGGIVRVGLSGADDPRNPYFQNNTLTASTSVVDNSQFNCYATGNVPAGKFGFCIASPAPWFTP